MATLWIMEAQALGFRAEEVASRSPGVANRGPTEQARRDLRLFVSEAWLRLSWKVAGSTTGAGELFVARNNTQ